MDRSADSLVLAFCSFLWSPTLHSKIEFDFDRNEYDEANPLVLPSKGSKAVHNVRKEKVAKQAEMARSKVLSKRKRKELERKIAQKEKKLSVLLIRFCSRAFVCMHVSGCMPNLRCVVCPLARWIMERTGSVCTTSKWIESISSAFI